MHVTGEPWALHDQLTVVDAHSDILKNVTDGHCRLGKRFVPAEVTTQCGGARWTSRASGTAEVDLHAEAARPSWDHVGDLVSHSANGHGESGMGLHAPPGGAEEPRPWRGPEYGREGSERQRDRARAGSAVILADVPAGTLGRDRGSRLLPQRGLDTARADHVLHAVRDGSPESTGSRGGLDPGPGRGFMTQAARRLTDAVEGFLARHRVLICDRDSKWTDGFRRIVHGAGVRLVLTPIQAPNANAHAERFVRSIRAACLNCLMFFGELRLLHALDEFVAHYHGERNRQGPGNELITLETRPLWGALRG